jgi:hypothetical protein
MGTIRDQLPAPDNPAEERYQLALLGIARYGVCLPPSRKFAPITMAPEGAPGCCQHCCHGPGQIPMQDDKPGTSPQTAVTPGQVWTVCPGLRIRWPLGGRGGIASGGRSGSGMRKYAAPLADCGDDVAAVAVAPPHGLAFMFPRVCT